MSRTGENIYKRKDGRWEGRFIKGRNIQGQAIYGFVYGKTYSDVKSKQLEAIVNSKDFDDIKDEERTVSFYFNVWIDHISHVKGSVFGGSDMGKIGVGTINPANNIATITTNGSTEVKMLSGYVKGSLFGGGNGEPSGKDENGVDNVYNSYMGNVFGTNNVYVYGGYVGNSVFGCGLQSKTYSGSNNEASNVFIDTTATSNDNKKAIVIGESVFGGGNKGSGTAINASVPTTFGNTHVTIRSKANEYAHIYFVSNGTNGGGIYGDGNLSLVEGTKTIDLENFSCGLGNASRLKTFYSLQRADVVNLDSSRVVLKGAVDLVAEDPSNTVYSINRVAKLNMKNSSTIKVVKTVNLFGELTSDYETNRQFINLGYNNGNCINGIENDNFKNDYTKHGGTNTSSPLTATEMNAYRVAYTNYASNGTKDNTYSSINVVAVANGGSIQIKTGDSTYGAVKGLFTLQLVDAVAGEGGGFIYADITKSTGNFICVTKMDESTTSSYMYVYQNVGGIFDKSNSKYEYYYWYLRGGKLSYDVSVEAIIGTEETLFEEKIVAPSDQNLRYILSKLTFTGSDEQATYIKSIIQDSWNESTDKNKTNIAIELMVETISSSGTTKTSIGYIGRGNVTVNSVSQEVWGINTSGGFVPSRDYMTTNLSFVKEQIPTLCTIDGTCTGVRFYFVLHKGLGITEEFRNYPFALTISQVTDTEYASYTAGSAINDDALKTKLTIDLFISAIRVVPSQSAYISDGRLYGGIASTTQFVVTGKSSFTAQFITKYVPSAFNSVTSNKLNDVILFAYNEIYLMAEMETPSGEKKNVGITATVNSDGTYTITHISEADDVVLAHYTINCNKTDPNNPIYSVSYNGGSEFKTVTADDPPVQIWFTCKLEETRTAGFKLPKNTVITLLASVNEGNPTYWYYYCTDVYGTSSIPLSDFCRMNSVLGTNTTDNANQALYSTSSSRVTEDLIFIFNFSNVSEANWTAAGNVNTSSSSTDTVYSDNLMLKHNYTATVGGTFDIMDFVQKTTESGNTTYTHIAPKNTNNFKLSLNEKAISSFTVEVLDSGKSMTQNCEFDIKFTITPNNAVVNTQYDERVFAVLLQLKEDGSGNVIAFPEGAVFTYNGEYLKTGMSNKYLIIPVRTTGEHVITVETCLDGFEVGNYTVVAELYSTTADGYYNSLQVIDKFNNTSVRDTFTIIADPVYKLKLSETSGKKNKIVASGDSFNFKVTAGGGEATDVINVFVYKLDNGNYIICEYTDVFEQIPNLVTCTDVSWTPELTDTVDSGIYRLALSYNSCTEYWDFIVE